MLTLFFSNLMFLDKKERGKVLLNFTPFTITSSDVFFCSASKIDVKTLRNIQIELNSLFK